ncbi:DUF885 family protein [Sphingomonas sp.]|uniref:DUF885 domain-containing protein n=1 Tax=Sphingomonas sp. TaxID=28214 RepID=UPI0018070EEE|nr:DUF885 domain-containing protein [Sphingomonas sp.]MBA3512515.1 DUF885 domain-containing protein [Sphingomonas sp.]
MNRILLLASTALLAACAAAPPPPPAVSAAEVPPVPPPTVEVATVPAKNAELAAFFDQVDKAELAMSPISKSYRAIKDQDYGKWDQFTDASSLAQRELGRRHAAELQARFDRATLSPEDQLSYDLFLYRNARSELIWPYREQSYVFDQMNGAHSRSPAFLINIHKVETVADAEAYVSRLSEMARHLRQAVAEAKQRQALGILPPKWVYPYVIADSRNVISGAPYGRGKDSALWADFKSKVEKLDADPATKTRLLASARAALLNEVRPAYQEIIALMQAQQRPAPTADGIWRFPNGAAQYQALTRYYTTTDLTPDQIHELGLQQVKRIHGEMEAIKNQVGFKGTLPEFFEHMRTSSQFYYPNTAAGKQMYLDESAKAQSQVQSVLPRFFGTLPKAPLLIKPVEPFREKSAGKAFYQDPPPDGSRPGIYYVNLYDMKDMPWTEVEALYCHEGIPGHHLQGALLSELGEGAVPPFRQFGGYTATDEGWGLYAEKLCKEMGLYQDPYRDFGRLQLELHRAIRLVVDSGIHHKRWSRERAIQYVEDNSADAKGGIVKAIERYVVYPGQATAYMVGKLKIEELRARAKQALGARYDDRGFHDTVLLAGSMPLDMLEKRVDEWIARVRAS